MWDKITGAFNEVKRFATDIFTQGQERPAVEQARQEVVKQAKPKVEAHEVPEGEYMPTWEDRLKQVAAPVGTAVAGYSTGVALHPGAQQLAEVQQQQLIGKVAQKTVLPQMEKDLKTPTEMGPLKRTFRNEVYAKGAHPNDFQVSHAEVPGAQYLPKELSAVYKNNKTAFLREQGRVMEHMQKGADGVVRNTVLAPNNPSVMAHEMGHALDFITPQGRERMMSYADPKGPASLHQHLKRGKWRVAGTALGNIEVGVDPTNPLPSIGAGVVSTLVDPHARKQIVSEVQANINGAKLLKKAGGKFNWPVMTAANGTYVANHALRGARQGFQGWLASVGLETGLKTLRDNVIDPVLNKVQPELAPEEKALEKYGYSRDKHRITADLESGNWKLDARYGKRGQ